jgi:hypothetical protein
VHRPLKPARSAGKCGFVEPGSSCEDDDRIVYGGMWRMRVEVRPTEELTPAEREHIHRLSEAGLGGGEGVNGVRSAAGQGQILRCDDGTFVPRRGMAAGSDRALRAKPVMGRAGGAR